MRLAAVAVLLALAVTAGVLGAISGKQAPPAAQEPPPNTVPVQRGELSSKVSLNGTLTHRARPDGSPYSAINRATGTYTWLPAEGDRVGCGDVLYRVDDDPVRMLCGTVPAYRDLDIGDRGKDVRQLNRNLRALGHDVDAGGRFTWKTEAALGGDGVVFLPKPVRVAKVDAELGGSARRGEPVLRATSDALEVRVELAASQQGEVRKGDRAQIGLPGNRSVKGTVDRLGRVARVAGEDDDAGAATIPAYIRLGDPRKARGFDRAPVRVDITTKGVQDALSVPVTALVGRSGGGFAVEVVRAGGRPELVAVEVGLFDTTAGRIEVEGGLDEGDRVVVPSP